MKFPLSVRLSVLLLLWSGFAATAAAVSCSSNTGGPAIIYIDAPSQIDINSDVSVGSTLASIDFWGKPSSVVEIRCVSVARLRTAYKMVTGSLGSDGITYATNISGIGMRIQLPNLAGQTVFLPVESSTTPNFSPGTSAYGKLELVKTGPISANGGVISGDLAIGQIHPADGGFHFSTYRLYSASTVAPKKPTCSIAAGSKSMLVPLGPVSQAVFTGVGTTSEARPFEIELGCAGGSSTTSVQIHAVLTDQTKKANRSDVLSLTQNSDAQGIGIQILKGTTVLRYGPDSVSPSAQNRWLAGSSRNGKFIIPLTARYVQTQPSVMPGSANAKATITFSYQ